MVLLGLAEERGLAGRGVVSSPVCRMDWPWSVPHSALSAAFTCAWGGGRRHGQTLDRALLRLCLCGLHSSCSMDGSWVSPDPSPICPGQTVRLRGGERRPDLAPLQKCLQLTVHNTEATTPVPAHLWSTKALCLFPTDRTLGTWFLLPELLSLQGSPSSLDLGPSF